MEMAGRTVSLILLFRYLNSILKYSTINAQYSIVN
jgi:hypothetical protein